MGIDRRHAGARIDQEEAGVGISDRRLGLEEHPPGERVRLRLVEAGRIDDGELEVAQPPLALAAVAGDAGKVVDQRKLPPDKAVEQRRLADIRPWRGKRGWLRRVAAILH